MAEFKPITVDNKCPILEALFSGLDWTRIVAAYQEFVSTNLGIARVGKRINPHYWGKGRGQGGLCLGMTKIYRSIQSLRSALFFFSCLDMLAIVGLLDTRGMKSMDTCTSPPDVHWVSSDHQRRLPGMVNSVGGFSITPENPICPDFCLVWTACYILGSGYKPRLGQNPGISIAVLLIVLCLSIWGSMNDDGVVMVAFSVYMGFDLAKFFFFAKANLQLEGPKQVIPNLSNTLHTWVC